jgi:hypothetical protein
VSGSVPSVFHIVIAYWRPSVPIRRRSNHDDVRSSCFALTTRKSPGRISQNCRAPSAFNLLRLNSFAAAAGNPKGVSSPLSCRHASISRNSRIRSVVTKSLLAVFPRNPSNTIFGRILRHGELTFASQPSAVFNISSPDLMIRLPPSEYTLPNPSRSPVLTSDGTACFGSMSRHQEQGWDGRI